MNNETFEKALSLACRILSDFADPIEGGWKRYLLERAETELICRICGCTEENACPDGCFWVETDLCSKCAANQDTEK